MSDLTYKEIDEIRIESLLYLLKDAYGVEEVSSKTQKSNGTRAFITYDGERFAVYASGMVRRLVSGYGPMDGKSCYQLNPVYKSLDRVIHFDAKDGKFHTMNTMVNRRAPITDEYSRLEFLFKFLVKNKYVTVGNYSSVNDVFYQIGVWGRSIEKR